MTRPVVVLGEALVELACTERWAAGPHVRLAFSGDALNTAAAVALSMQGQGGTGLVPGLAQTRAQAGAAA